MNDVNIFQEFVDLIQRHHYSYTEIAFMAGAKNKQSVGQWITKGRIKEEYVINLANSVDDDRFVMAMNCYIYHLPSALLDLVNEFTDDSLGLLIGTQEVDTDSDGAISNMVHELSKKEPDIGVIKLGVKKMTRTSEIMMLASRKLCNRFGITMKQAVLERG
ncbi:hypothetical protein D1B17_07190 [Companilactobacillus zhachilii]|uniref:Uncharacterized protein n=1 Tax=Companilactobacillus zhachilii TaxID=2304606 RepID=A0A386PUQ8_9LACO|nr:hypothetical protein [Companilactobacillus zhachilii]AYE38433.1 hypothetical protein D1B17_07190 [Companilactobacillus zhachilii]